MPGNILTFYSNNFYYAYIHIAYKKNMVRLFNNLISPKIRNFARDCSRLKCDFVSEKFNFYSFGTGPKTKPNLKWIFFKPKPNWTMCCYIYKKKERGRKYKTAIFQFQKVLKYFSINSIFFFIYRLKIHILHIFDICNLAWT